MTATLEQSESVQDQDVGQSESIEDQDIESQEHLISPSSKQTNSLVTADDDGLTQSPPSVVANDASSAKDSKLIAIATEEGQDQLTNLSIPRSGLPGAPSNGTHVTAIASSYSRPAPHYSRRRYPSYRSREGLETIPDEDAASEPSASSFSVSRTPDFATPRRSPVKLPTLSLDDDEVKYLMSLPGAPTSLRDLAIQEAELMKLEALYEPFKLATERTISGAPLLSHECLTLESLPAEPKPLVPSGRCGGGEDAREATAEDFLNPKIERFPTTRRGILNCLANIKGGSTAEAVLFGPHISPFPPDNNVPLLSHELPPIGSPAAAAMRREVELRHYGKSPIVSPEAQSKCLSSRKTGH